MKYSDNNMSCHHREASGSEQPLLPVKMQQSSSIFKPRFLNNLDAASQVSDGTLEIENYASKPRKGQDAILSSTETQDFRDGTHHGERLGPTPRVSNESAGPREVTWLT